MSDAYPIAVLGPVSAAGRDGRPADLPGVLAKRLLAALALAPGCAAGVPALIDALWGDEPPRNPRAALQTLVSRLRHELADGLLLSTPTGYAVPADAVDLNAARRARATAPGLDAAARADAATRALVLWRGEPGADLGDAPVAADLAEQAGELGIRLRRMRAEAFLDAADPASALGDLALLAAALPFEESIQLLRMRALAASGRRNEALAAFAAFRNLLADSLGTDPGQALVEENAALLRETDDGPVARIGLRYSATELLGRDEDVAALSAELRAARVTTILGPGGLGKTRLAQEVARRSDLPAVVFVELAGVRDEADVPIVVASTLGIAEARLGRRIDPNLGRNLQDRIERQLAERDTLLVLDNCEHLIEGVARWVGETVGAVPRLRVLTTSRAPLAITGERVYPLAPLPSDDEDAPAVRLFLDRATAVRPGAVLPPDAVARICAHLDGLPLAIELAAARVRSMSVEDVEERLGRRFALLTGGDRSAPERHRTLLAVIEWSWRLLTPVQQQVLRRLAVFPDGFSAEGAASVAGAGDDVSAELDAIVQQSLLQVREDPQSGRLRYRMLETVREFGELALAEADEADGTRTAMRDWATSFCERESAALRGTDVVGAVQRVAEEQENLLAILRRAFDEGDGATALVLFGALGGFWTLRGAHSEVANLAPALLAVDRDYRPEGAALASAAVALVIASATLLAVRSATSLRLRALLQQMTEGRTDLDPALAAQVRLVVAAPRVEDFYPEVLRQRDDPDLVIAAFASVILGQLQENRGEIDAAIQSCRRGYELNTRLGNAWGRAMSAQALASLYSQSAQSEAVLEWAAIGREGMVAIDATADLIQTDWLVALAQIALGRFPDARRTLQELVPATPGGRGEGMARQIVEWEVRVMISSALAELVAEEGDLDAALAQHGLALERGEPRQSFASTWQYLGAAACLGRTVVAGYDRWSPEDVEWFGEVGRRLRVRMLAEYRLRPGVVDRPVLGGVIAGYGAWLAARPTASAIERRRGAELVALAHILHSREDLPSLRLDRLAAAVGAVAGDEFAAARDRAAPLSLENATARVHELLLERGV